MKESTTDVVTAEQMKALVNGNLIGGILIGVTAAWTVVHAKRWLSRKAIRINRRNKEMNDLNLN